jgi:hypothetical protein
MGFGFTLKEPKRESKATARGQEKQINLSALCGEACGESTQTHMGAHTHTGKHTRVHANMETHTGTYTHHRTSQHIWSGGCLVCPHHSSVLKECVTYTTKP